nr:MAG TPA: hypothetical protein [Caudoviricetes sp.]
MFLLPYPFLLKQGGICQRSNARVSPEVLTREL